MEKISHRSMALIWFSAAISASQILIGTWFSPLGWQQGLQVIVIGHVIGGVFLFLAGVIGAKTGKTAMESVQMSFGQHGSGLFSVLNALQMVGWTAISLYVGTEVIAVLIDLSAFPLPWLTAALAALVIGWLLLGLTRHNWLQYASLMTMLLLVLWLSYSVFRREFSPDLIADGSVSFGTGVEMAAAAPISWIPVIADYTRHAKSPLKSSLFAALVYVLSSSLMLALGLAAVLVNGEDDIAAILLLGGVSLVGIAIIVVSTVILSSLTSYSAGMSLNTLSPRLPNRLVAIVVIIASAILAATQPVSEATNLLLIISSVFAPMIVVLLADFFLLKRDASAQRLDITALLLWLAAFAVYRWLMVIGWETPLGLTLPMIGSTFTATLIVRRLTTK